MRRRRPTRFNLSPDDTVALDTAVGQAIQSFTGQLHADDVQRIKAAILGKLEREGWTISKSVRDYCGGGHMTGIKLK